MMYERVVRPTLFRIGRGDAENAHETTLRWLARTGRSRTATRALAAAARARVDAPRTVFGVRFPSPLGLAAGMDKDGRALAAWPALGFGFVEVGTVTARAQPGNERPRLFRLPESVAVINRMGFNNAGASALAARLDAIGPLAVPLGISIGKSKVTPMADAVGDYVASVRALRGHGDYLAVNVSSPNTPGLRTLQDAAVLADLLGALQGELAGAKPLLVKIAPDLSDEAISELLEVCVAHDVAGVIATNTTLRRDGLAPADAVLAGEAGGLSGRPLADRAREVVAFVHKQTGGRLPIIGVGGIATADDALRLLDAGASLLQLYTGLIFRGPALVREINRGLPAEQA
ncbi:MAG TPA: quinone-dependent dihydroorotate dehydrogenase [Micromonosporaceae bacterium]|nr:quinone-dependent dihydroorotate dehydrogenase [Micromonosporaceae bacterium]